MLWWVRAKGKSSVIKKDSYSHTFVYSSYELLILKLDSNKMIVD